MVVHVIIVGGGGEIGFALAQALSKEHEVFIIDHAPFVADRFERLDVQVLLGSGTSAEALGRAGSEWLGGMGVIALFVAVLPRLAIGGRELFFARPDEKLTTLFDAVCHSMTTMAAGGFSPHPLSIAGYGSTAIDWTSFVHDEELRTYVVVVAAAAIVPVLRVLETSVPGWSGGPHGEFADLHPVSKIVLTLEMWIGRLGVLTVLVFFRFEAWRTARWSAA